MNRKRQPSGLAAAATSNKLSIESLRWLLPGAGLVLYVIVATRCMWQSDDAYISYRTVDNFLSGRGLVWNVGERVQAYTHAFWLFLVAAAAGLTGEVYYSSLVLSLVFSGIALGLIVFGLARTLSVRLLVLALAMSSKALVDYSTSGLENPCSHLLIAAACLVFLRMNPSPRRVLVLSLVSALACLNRQDSVLLVAPLLLVALAESPTRRGLAAAAAGMMPLVGWEVFSAAYYGSLVPNTAHAKLGHGVARLALVEQGWWYFANSLLLDPLTLVVTGVAVGVALYRGDRRVRAIAVGIVTYLLYVLWIGGDFMSGRFFSTPFVAALVLIARWPMEWPLALGFGCVALAASLASPRPPLTSGSDCGHTARHELIDRHGVSDERAYYYPWTGLLVARPGSAGSLHPWALRGERLAASGQRVAVEGNTGFVGYFAGPEVYIIDPHALSDALLSRLPVIAAAGWRIGHLEHALPEGYVETKLRRSNHLEGADLRAYYDRLQFVIAGPFWDGRRLAAAAPLALGLDGPPTSLARFRNPPLAQVEAAKLPDDPLGRIFSWPGIVVRTHGQRGKRLRINLDADDAYGIVFLAGDAQVGTSEIAPEFLPPTAGLVEHTFSLPADAIGRPLDALAILPLFGDGGYAVGRIELLP